MQYLPSNWQSSLVLGLQIYYPLFYILRLARNTTGDSIEPQASLKVEQITLLGSVAATLIWALWLNVSHLLSSLQVVTFLSKYNIGGFGPVGNQEGNQHEDDAESSVPEHQLNTTPDVGLNLREVEERRCLYGYNEVTSSPRVSWKAGRVFLWSCIDDVTLPLEVGLVRLFANVSMIVTDLQR